MAVRSIFPSLICECNTGATLAMLVLTSQHWIDQLTLPDWPGQWSQISSSAHPSPGRHNYCPSRSLDRINPQSHAYIHRSREKKALTHRNGMNMHGSSRLLIYCQRSPWSIQCNRGSNKSSRQGHRQRLYYLYDNAGCWCCGRFYEDGWIVQQWHNS